MKRKCLHLTVQPHAQNSFWIENAINGMQEEAARCASELSFLTDTARDLQGELVYIVGTSEVFCRAESERILAQGGHPFLVNGGMPRMDGVACVAFDIEGAIRRSLSYLFSCGKRSILLFGLNPASYADKLKLDAFRFYTEYLGIKGDVRSCAGSIGEAARELILAPTEAVYDAILAVNDTAALSLLSSGIGKKVKIPEELFLMGMGNSILAGCSGLPLTTVDFDYTRLGRLAVRAGLLIRKSESLWDARFLLPCELIVRRSTGAVTAQTVLPLPTEGETEQYFSDEGTKRLLTAEALLQTSREPDRSILILLSEGKTYAQIAEAVFLTERAVSYRVDALKRRMSVRHVGEIKALFQNVLSENAEK